MKTDDLVSSDLQALAAVTSRRFPAVNDTARALDESLAGRADRRPLRRPASIGVAFAAAAAVVLVPVPYRHQSGWDATVRSSASGRAVTVHLTARDGAEAERRAVALGRSMRAAVSVAPHTELTWGSVYAMARDRFFRLDVDLDGKTDAEAEAEIRAQLVDQGWTPGDVAVERSEGTTTVRVGANDGAGQQIELVQRSDDPAMNRVQMAPEPIDDKREPGMTDAQLRDKILRQLQARGLEGEVTVNGDAVEIRVRKGK